MLPRTERGETMKILVVGGTGIIGKAVVSLLGKEHELISVGKRSGDYQVDIEDKASITKMFEDFKNVDGVIATTGMAAIGPFQHQTDEDLSVAVNNKLMGQVNLIRVGIHHINKNGFIIVTSGSATHTPMPGMSSITMAGAGLEGYVRAINVENESEIRVSVVSPALVKETMELMNIELPGAVSAADTAKVYRTVMESRESGIIAHVS